jgi:primary-amine oxidase
VEAIVSVTRGEVDRWDIVRDVRPALQIEESIGVLAALYDHPEWNAALDRRGIVDRSMVQIDPWPAGTFGLGHEEGRRITRCLAYLRESKEDNGYARPLEGLLAFVDMGRGEVLEVLDIRQLLPRGQRPVAHRSQAARDHAAGGPELRGRGQPGPLAEVVAARRHGPSGGPRPLHGRL